MICSCLFCLGAARARSHSSALLIDLLNESVACMHAGGRRPTYSSCYPNVIITFSYYSIVTTTNMRPP